MLEHEKNFKSNCMSVYKTETEIRIHQSACLQNSNIQKLCSVTRRMCIISTIMTD